jgi:hypothetical protein
MPVQDPFQIAHKEIRELHEFIALCHGSLQAAALTERMTRTLYRFGKESGTPIFLEKDRETELLASTSELATRSQKLLADGVPHLYRMSTIWLWTIFEASFDDLFVEFISEEEQWRKIPALTELKGPLVEFMSVTEGARSRMLMEALKVSIRASLKVGVGRFEEVLNALGIGGSVNEVVGVPNCKQKSTRPPAWCRRPAPFRPARGSR